MVTNLLILIGSLAILIVGAEALVRGASRLALRLGISAFVVGITVVGLEPAHRNSPPRCARPRLATQKSLWEMLLAPTS